MSNLDYILAKRTMQSNPPFEGIILQNCSIINSSAGISQPPHLVQIKGGNDDQTRFEVPSVRQAFEPN